MSEVAIQLKTHRFDQMAVQVKDKVHPSEADVARYVGLEHIDPESLKIRRWGEPSDVESSKILFRSGDIIFGKRRAYQRKLAVANFDGICSAHAMVLRPKTDVVLKEFLPFFMQTDAFMERAVKISVGGLSPTINWKDLASEEFALPPIEEQRRMAMALSATETALDKLRLLAENATLTARSLLDVRLQRLAAFIPLTPVVDLLVDGPKNGLSPKVNSEERGLRTVSIGAVADGRFNPDGQVKYVDLTPDKAAPYLVQKGDIFAVRGNGNRQLVARVGRSTQSYDDLVYPDLLMRMRFAPDRIDPDFLLAQWNHPSVHARLLARAKSSNGISKVNGQDIRAHALLVPPLHEQEKIAALLGEFTSARSEAERRMLLLRQVKRKIMTSMHGGGNE